MAFSLFDKKEVDAEKANIDELVDQLREVQITIVEYGNNTAIDLKIAEMIGMLKARQNTEVSQSEIIEFLVYLSDVTRTKQDSMNTHYSDTMFKIVHAKIDMLLMYHKKIASLHNLSSLFSFKNVLVVIVLFLGLIGVLIGAHKYDPKVFDATIGQFGKSEKEEK